MLNVVTWRADGSEHLRFNIRRSATLRAAMEKAVLSVVFTGDKVPAMPAREERLYYRSFATPDAAAHMLPRFILEPLPRPTPSGLVALVREPSALADAKVRLTGLRRRRAMLLKNLVQVPDRARALEVVQARIARTAAEISEIKDKQAAATLRRATLWQDRLDAILAARQARQAATMAARRPFRAARQRTLDVTLSHGRPPRGLSGLDLSLRDMIERDLPHLSPEACEAFKRRAGFDRPSETRMVAGEGMNVPWVLIGLLEEEALRTFAVHSGWPKALRGILEPQLPVAVDDLTSQRWAQGFDGSSVESIARFALSGRMGIVSAGGRRFMSAMDERAWIIARLRARSAVQRAAPDVDRETCFSKATAELGAFAGTHGWLLAEDLGWPDTDVPGWRAKVEGNPTPAVAIERTLADPAPISMEKALAAVRSLVGGRVERHVVEKALRAARRRMPNGLWVIRDDSATP